MNSCCFIQANHLLLRFDKLLPPVFAVLIHTLFGAAPCITGAAMDDQAVAFGIGRDELNSRVHRPDGSALHCKIFEFLQRHCATALNQNNFDQQIDPVLAQTSVGDCHSCNAMNFYDCKPTTRWPRSFAHSNSNGLCT